eukprot:TRINITY_DN10622_c3_g1_i3.p1 TRINITY_DN10622_c3_g1~~TRINITY_DN10622_c3_g1_i3.p1  ORF type:complete len:118 (+),score=29.87 TRINITY_DN10622_c3_g1_i3:1-354(+)
MWVGSCGSPPSELPGLPTTVCPEPVAPVAPPVAPVDEFQWFRGSTTEFTDATAVGSKSPTNTLTVGSGDIDSYFFVQIHPADGSDPITAKAFFVSGAYGCTEGAATEAFGKKLARRH